MSSAAVTALKVGGKELRPLQTLGCRRPATQAALWLGAGPAGASELVILQQQPFEDEEALRALDDAHALTRLRHANVARFRVIADVEGELVIVSDFVEGVTLAELRSLAQARGLTLPLAVVVRVALDVLAGLGAIHALRDKAGQPLRRIHGDLAPDDVVIAIDGSAKIIGLHHRVWEGERGIEPLRFMAPEVLLGDDQSDGRADLYAVAVMIWEAIAGKPIFDETTPAAILARHLSGRIPPLVPAVEPTTTTRGWIASLAAMASRGVGADPETRSASASKLSAEIREIVGGAVASAHEVGALVRDLAGDVIAARRRRLAPAEKPLVRAPSKTQIGLVSPVISPRVVAQKVSPKAPPNVEAAPTSMREVLDLSDFEDVAPLATVSPLAPAPLAPAPPPASVAAPSPAPPAVAPVVFDAAPPPVTSAEVTIPMSDRITSRGSAADHGTMPLEGVETEAPLAPAKKRRRGAVLAILLLGGALVLFGVIRSMEKSGSTREASDRSGNEATRAATLTPVPKTSTNAYLAATPTATATTAPTLTTTTTTTTTPTTTTNTATSTATVTATAAAPVTNAATTTATIATTQKSLATTPKTTPTTPTLVHPKAKPTYDPLGI